ncbi:response regulator transcription factor [Cognaticolwellia mytili]|uniref:response regulator transcription factor n=1 Tax=Cognaticolwellia mytili TaxID=1888913 RepID=UPI000A16E52B|nr:response regulator transcription factor [Cognaticolwellia mytili]
MKILIVEDDAEISRLTAMYLNAEGFESKIINDGADALAAIKSYHPDLIVLDLMLPGMSGLDICKQARLFYLGPILVLTACDDDVSEVSLLKFGADDFLNKPLKPHILVARIEALIRRSSVTNPESRKLQHSKLHINSVNREVFLEGNILALTDSEYEMLHLLDNNVGKIVSRDDCCRALRGIDYDFNDRSIDMRISALRKKLNDDKMPYKIITTVRNKGYMLLNG